MLAIFRPEARSRRSLSRSSSSPTNFEASDLHKTEFPSKILYAWTILPILMPVWSSRKVLILRPMDIYGHLWTYWNDLQNKTCRISVRRIRIGLDGSLLLYARTSGHGGSGRSKMVEDVGDGDIHQQCLCSELLPTLLLSSHTFQIWVSFMSREIHSCCYYYMWCMKSTGNFYQNAHVSHRRTW